MPPCRHDSSGLSLSYVLHDAVNCGFQVPAGWLGLRHRPGEPTQTESGLTPTTVRGPHRETAGTGQREAVFVTVQTMSVRATNLLSGQGVREWRGTGYRIALCQDRKPTQRLSAPHSRKRGKRSPHVEPAKCPIERIPERTTEPIAPAFSPSNDPGQTPARFGSDYSDTPRRMRGRNGWAGSTTAERLPVLPHCLKMGSYGPKQK